MDEIEEDWFGPDAATFGDRIAGAREAAGMTQAQLARRLGVKKATIEAWEQDLSEPRANRLSMTSGVLNVSIIWLLTGEGEGAATPKEDEPDWARDLSSALAEMRSIRNEMRASSERMAKLEKRLRAIASAG